MPRSPRPDETRAAQLVRTHCGLGELRYADVPNGVDFVGRADGRRVALEVTRFTSQDRRRDPAVAHATTGRPLRTRHSWLVFCAEPPAIERLEPALQDLERHRIRDYHVSLMGWWLRSVPTLRDALESLAAERVVSAQIVELRPPRLFLATGGEDGGGDADTALAALEEHLAHEAHHLAKTAAAEADERHLFVWLDGATPPDCAGVFVGDSAPPLPTRAPAVPAPITHVWVVHEQTGRGWHWQRPGETADGGWTALTPG